MRQFNFIVLFVGTLIVAFFAMQNASPVAVQFIPGIEFKSPLVLQLLISAGLGAAIAYIYSVWTQAQFTVEARKKDMELAEKEIYINQLKEMVVDLESTAKQLPPSKRAEPTTEEEESSEEATTA